MLVMIRAELASNRQVDIRQVSEVNSEILQHEGVLLVHAKPGADADACRRGRHPGRCDLTKLHDVDSDSRRSRHNSNLCSDTAEVKHAKREIA
jgi:hypothetical protein